jgi:hypothetical protein
MPGEGSDDVLVLGISQKSIKVLDGLGVRVRNGKRYARVNRLRHFGIIDIRKRNAVTLVERI